MDADLVSGSHLSMFPPFPGAPYPLQAVSRDLVKRHLTQLALELGLNRG